jgi:hypothetical protein
MLQPRPTHTHTQTNLQIGVSPEFQRSNGFRADTICREKKKKRLQGRTL